jgi:hypothetical protein
MSYLHRIADRLAKRRMTFAQPRPPKLSALEDVAHFLQRYVPDTLLWGTAIVTVILVMMASIALVGALLDAFGTRGWTIGG